MQSFDLRGKDGTRLAGYCWEASGEVRGEVLLIHGGFEHLGRYEHVATRLTALGLRVTGSDLRGHGRSDGRRGYVERWQDYLDDIRLTSQRIEGPYWVLGHSQGGLIGIEHALDNDRVTGMMLSGPLVGIAVEAPRLKLLGARVLSRILPKLSMDNELKVEMISSDPEEVAKYEKDPLVYGTLTPRYFTEMTKAMERANEASSRFTVPAWIHWGAADPIVAPSAVESFAGRYGGPVTTKAWAGMRHEIFNERDKDAVLDALTTWLDEQMQERKTA